MGKENTDIGKLVQMQNVKMSQKKHERSKYTRQTLYFKKNCGKTLF